MDAQPESRDVTLEGTAMRRVPGSAALARGVFGFFAIFGFIIVGANLNTPEVIDSGIEWALVCLVLALSIFVAVRCFQLGTFVSDAGSMVVREWFGSESFKREQIVKVDTVTYRGLLDNSSASAVFLMLKVVLRAEDESYAGGSATWCTPRGGRQQAQYLNTWLKSGAPT